MTDNTMTYRGYTASIEFSKMDDCFIGEVLGMRLAMISFEGASIEELRQDFHNAIDFYLKDCAANNEEPERPSSFDIQLELPADIFSRITSAAEAAGHSTNDMIVSTLETAYPAANAKVKSPRQKVVSARAKSSAARLSNKRKNRETAGAK